MKNPRYLVFGYNEYYPGGGWTDFLFATNDKDEAFEKVKTFKREMFDIVDLETMEEIYNEISGETKNTFRR